MMTMTKNFVTPNMSLSQEKMEEQAAWLRYALRCFDLTIGVEKDGDLFCVRVWSNNDDNYEAIYRKIAIGVMTTLESSQLEVRS